MITRQMNKHNLASLLELAKTANTMENPELYIAYFAFLISKHLPENQSDEQYVDFFRRSIEMLAVEADSELNLMVETCPMCGRHYLAFAGGRAIHYCSRNGSQEEKD
jgi:hypothetical protein